jgi:hypothetical protein
MRVTLIIFCLLTLVILTATADAVIIFCYYLCCKSSPVLHIHIHSTAVSLSAYLQILGDLSKDVAKRLATFEREVLRRMFGKIRDNENWRKRYTKEVMQLCGDYMHFFCQIKLVELYWSC